jgi:hypothetical protein
MALLRKRHQKGSIPPQNPWGDQNRTYPRTPDDLAAALRSTLSSGWHGEGERAAVLQNNVRLGGQKGHSYPRTEGDARSAEAAKAAARYCEIINGIGFLGVAGVGIETKQPQDTLPASAGIQDRPYRDLQDGMPGNAHGSPRALPRTTA